MTSPLLAAGRQIAGTLIEAGYETYFVGGYVRDCLRKEEPHDMDITTIAHPSQVLKLFPNAHTIGAHFGVLLIRNNGFDIEIATFRHDGEYLDSRHPKQVKFASAKEDVLRRDFTVNGLLQHPFSNKITDFVGGEKDLEQGILRSIGDPYLRLQEDALRLLRAIRFSCTKGLRLDPQLYIALQANAHLLQNIAPERIQEEFNKMMLSPKRGEALDLLVSTGLIKFIIPEVLDLIGSEQSPQWHPEGDVYTHTRLMLDLLGAKPSLPLVLAALLHDIAKPLVQKIDENGLIHSHAHDTQGALLAEQILRKLKYSNKIIQAVTKMVRRHMQFTSVPKMRESTLRQFMSSEEFPDELLLHRADRLSASRSLENLEIIEKFSTKIKDTPLLPKALITGEDLLALGFSPSPLFKKIIDQAYQDQLEELFKDKASALEWTKTQLAR